MEYELTNVDVLRDPMQFLTSFERYIYMFMYMVKLQSCTDQAKILCYIINAPRTCVTFLFPSLL